jgi:hypothetical protein
MATDQLNIGKVVQRKLDRCQVEAREGGDLLTIPVPSQALQTAAPTEFNECAR